MTLESKRTALVLTTNKTSPRARFSEKVLTDVGFTVEFVQHIPHPDPIVSNKQSMQAIYARIARETTPMVYVFEDDINILQNQQHYLRLYSSSNTQTRSSILVYVNIMETLEWLWCLTAIGLPFGPFLEMSADCTLSV